MSSQPQYRGLGRFGTENPMSVRVYRCSIVLIRRSERPPRTAQDGLLGAKLSCTTLIGVQPRYVQKREVSDSV